MNYVMEKEKQIQIAYECDVLIAGGGTAGISAALAAARQGANVLLVEQEWMLGGLATAGLVTVFCRCVTDTEHNTFLVFAKSF